jgi:uncharacterized protein (PEP-CTERM system associated)
VRSIGFGLLCLAGAGPVRADVKITPGLAVSETYTDNVRLVTGDGDRSSDFITSLSPSVKLRSQGGRINLNLDYAPQYNLHQVATERNGLQQNLLGAGHAELWQRAFFLDTQASISQAIANSTGPVVNSVAGQEVNRTTVKALNVTPIFRHHFGTWVDTESRITGSIVDQDGGSASNGTAGLQAQNTQTLSESLHIGSGRRFTTFLWAVDLFSSKTTDDSGLGDRHRDTLDTNYSYVWNRYLSLLAGVGYEKLKDPTLLQDFKGPTWNVGASWRPSLLTSIQATTGDRDDTRTTNVSATHRLSSRTSITASYNESLQTSAQQISQSLNFLTLDPNTGVLIDSRTGQPFVPGSTEFGLQKSTFRQHQLQIRFSGSRRRNSFSGGITWEKRNTESTGVTETVAGMDMQFTRQLTHISSATASISYRKHEYGTADGRKDDEIGGSLSYAYQLLKDVDARMTYNLTLIRSSVSVNDLKENSFTLALVKRF